eukprot:ANDGO_01908.mRNA.1 hypothetical protein
MSTMQGTAVLMNTQRGLAASTTDVPVSFLRETRQLVTDITAAHMSASQLAGYGAFFAGVGVVLAGTGVLAFGVSVLLTSIKTNFFPAKDPSQATPDMQAADCSEHPSVA